MAGKTGRAGHETAALDQPAADAGRDGDEGHAARAGTGPEAVLAPGSGVGIVEEADTGTVQCLAESLCQRVEARQGEGGRVDGIDPAARHEPRGRDADRLARGEPACHEARDGGDDAVARSVAGGGHGPSLQDLGFDDAGRRDLGAADVDGDRRFSSCDH